MRQNRRKTSINKTYEVAQKNNAIMERNLSMDECKAIAAEAHNQLFCSITPVIYHSWGVYWRTYGFYEDMPTLMLKVSGAVHKGWVYVSLNEGKDLYEVRLLNKDREVVALVDEVYFDDLGSLIDSMIERPIGMSDEEYEELAMADSIAKATTEYAC